VHGLEHVAETILGKVGVQNHDGLARDAESEFKCREDDKTVYR